MTILYLSYAALVYNYNTLALLFHLFLPVCFQEIAVIHRVPRTANIIARENIEVLVVDPPTCFRIFPEEINREYKLTLDSMR